MDGQAFLDKEIIVDNPGLVEYGNNATGGKPLDFKAIGIAKATQSSGPVPNLRRALADEQHNYRGGVLRTGEIATARDVGNVATGIVAARNGLSWRAARFGFDALKNKQRLNPAMLRTGPVSEGRTSILAQRRGFTTGSLLRSSD